MVSHLSVARVGLLLLAVISSIAAQDLIEYKDGLGETIITDGDCILTCSATTTDGTPLPLVPRVVWKRQLATQGTPGVVGSEYRSLTDPYWYKKGISFTLQRTVCSGTEGEKGFYYDCKFRQKNCNRDLHRGTYQCILLNEHDGKMYSQINNLYVGSMIRPNDGNQTCFFPMVIQSSLTATYNDSTGITLHWDTNKEDLPSDQYFCENSRTFSVLVRSYSSYNHYILFEDDPDQVQDYSGTVTPQGTEFIFPSEIVKLGNYYVFDIRNENTEEDIDFENPLRNTTTPLYYLGYQEKPYLSYPAEQTTVMQVTAHSTFELRCEGKGTPTPTVDLRRSSGLRLTSEDSDPTIARKSLVATPESAGSYHCVAHSTYVPPEGGAEPVHNYKTYIIEIIERDLPDSEMICAPNGNTLCSAVFGGFDVLVNTTDQDLQIWVDNSVSALDNFALNGTMRHNASFAAKLGNCIDLAKAMVCHSSFPFCSESPLVTRPICNNTCEVFGPGGACENILDLELFPGISSVMFSNCDTRIQPAGESPECVYVPLGTSTSETSWCVRGDGQSYAGDVFVTTSNTVCQDWAAQSPHMHFSGQPELLHRASRQCRNPGGSGERTWCYTNKMSLRWEYCDVQQCSVCEEYRGISCSHLPGYDRGASVYVDRHESEWGQESVNRADVWMYNVLLKLFSNHPDLPQGCEAGMRELLCHRTLPLCQADSVTPSALCSEHCKLARLLQVCPQNLLRRLEGEMGETGVSFLEPVCELEGEQCLTLRTSLSAGASAVTVGMETQVVSCYNSTDNGLNYTGTVSTTAQGATCQAWGPDYPDIGNYCRNPGNFGMRPWCFTDEDGNQWDYCDIPKCTTERVTESTAETEPVQLGSVSVGLISTFAIIGFVLILISIVLAIIIVLYCRFKSHQQAHCDLDLLKLNKDNKRKWDYVVNQTYVQVGGPPVKIEEAMENYPKYSKSSIKYIRQIGQGNFGVVFYAKAEGLVEDEKVTDVAVKTMREENSAEGLNDFVREAKLMFNFDHKNIVKIFGVSIEDIPYYLIFEFMDKGDLAQYLRVNASSLQRRVMNPTDGRPRSRTESTMSDEPPTLTVEQLTDICKQIAEGMNYLETNNHVHRDLACRNCLVKSCDWDQTDSGLIIKIGDFGMSQNLYSSDYYRVRGQAVLPVRWMSPEAIIYGKFSTESDVWSFGVVMWEVFSFAMQPYYGTSNEEVTECIRGKNSHKRKCSGQTR